MTRCPCVCLMFLWSRRAASTHDTQAHSWVQVETYNAATELWQRVRAELATAMSLTGAGNDLWRTFWAAQQRFFKLLCVSLKTPAVVATAKAALADGHCVVIGLQSTGTVITNLTDQHCNAQVCYRHL